jgi:hypothetical protein
MEPSEQTITMTAQQLLEFCEKIVKEAVFITESGMQWDSYKVPALDDKRARELIVQQITGTDPIDSFFKGGSRKCLGR